MNTRPAIYLYACMPCTCDLSRRYPVGDTMTETPTPTQPAPQPTPDPAPQPAPPPPPPQQ
jgi:hypothetical protein